MTSKSNNSKTTSKTTSKSNSTDPKIVGHGTYGCVTKPMIPCSNAKVLKTQHDYLIQCGMDTFQIRSL